MTARRGWVLAIAMSTVIVLIAVAALLRPGGADPTTRPAARSTVEAAPPSAGPKVIVPGRPGEPALARPAQEVRDAAPPAYNTLDTWFVRMMIPHHAQALRMAALADDRAADPGVRALADRIRASQAPEIGMMRGWLQARGLDAEVAGHDHGSMRGMQSPTALRQLAAARGAEFDRLFVRMMTEHHQGAVEMATNLLKVGVDLALSEFANSVAAEQTVEIDRMRDLLTGR